eukprot:gene18577-25086_t
MSHHFYLQNGSRRSAQAFPIAIAPGAKFSEAKETFGEMLGVPPEQIICLTTADGGIVLPGQSIPEEPLILEVERRAFDMLTGAGTFASPGSPLSMGAISNVAPGTPANFADPFDSVLRDVPADYVRAVQTMAAGVIILLIGPICWTISKAGQDDSRGAGHRDRYRLSIPQPLKECS